MAKREIADSRTIVTGASGGIGRELVLQLSRQGGHSVAVARGEEKLEKLADEVAAAQSSNGRVEFVVGDVTNPLVRQAAIDRAQQMFGGLDAVINNAAIGSFGRFAEADPARLREIMEVNFFAAADLIRDALPALRESQQAIVVNIGSVLGYRGLPQMHEYCASKFALRGLSQSLRVELKPLGIDLLLVSPGTVSTDFYEHAIAGRDQVPWSQGPSVTPAAVATATLRAMRRGRREIAPNAYGRMLLWANRVAPWAVDRFLARYA